MHNKSIPGRNWPASNIRIFRSEERSPVNLLVQCQQCENAPCVKTCPFGANYYDENGLVVQSINTLSIKQMRTQCLQASISSGRSPVPHSLA
ncbi:4Fe-4S dicluster domain-containing protein [Parasutterella sp.]|uniref:4Fe-4S dicluster domain-containing protein n=1 Tax=Parasutterella sp. TaxID=2049037 RepID=UPI00352280B5